MEFAWDPTKSDATYAARGFGFAVAASIFAGRVIEAEDTRHDYGEVRIQAIGQAAIGLVLAVIYTDRGGVRRIISARIASKRERAEWLRQSA
jgi:uncharacterized DUF497 family protein